MIKRPVYQDGARVATGWPLKLNRFEATAPPDPADVLDCILILNDRTDGIPRARVVISNGASFDTLAYITDIAAPQAHQTIALTPQIVTQQLPALPPPTLFAPAQYDDTSLRAQIESLHRRVSSLEGVIDALHTMASSRLKDRT